MTTADSHIGSNRQHRLSDQVPANTDYQSDMQCVPSDAPASKSPISLVILPLRAQASKPAPGLNRGRCETQAPLGGKPPSFASVSVPCPLSARSGNLIAGDGTKNALPAPNKELVINRKEPLDRKSPIQVRIQSPPAPWRRYTSGNPGGL